MIQVSQLFWFFKDPNFDGCWYSFFFFLTVLGLYYRPWDFSLCGELGLLSIFGGLALILNSGHPRPGEGRRAAFGSSFLLGHVGHRCPFGVQGTRRNVGFRWDREGFQAVRETTDVWRREGLNANGLQQIQVHVLERLESGRPVLKAWLPCRWHHRVRRAWRVPGPWPGRAEQSGPAQEPQGWTKSSCRILSHTVGVSHILSTSSFMRIFLHPGSWGRARVERIWCPHFPVPWADPWHPHPHTDPTGTFTDSLTHQSTESILLILGCQTLISTALQGISSFQYIRGFVILFNLFDIGVMASRYEQVDVVPQGLADVITLWNRKIRGNSLKDTHQNTLFPSLSWHAQCCPGKVSESLGSPGPSHSLLPTMRSKAVQSSRRAPARVMLPVADAPYSPGALLYLCLSSPSGGLCQILYFSGDSARP